MFRHRDAPASGRWDVSTTRGQVNAGDVASSEDILPMIWGRIKDVTESRMSTSQCSNVLWLQNFSRPLYFVACQKTSVWKFERDTLVCICLSRQDFSRMSMAKERSKIKVKVPMRRFARRQKELAPEKTRRDWKDGTETSAERGPGHTPLLARRMGKAGAPRQSGLVVISPCGQAGSQG